MLTAPAAAGAATQNINCSQGLFFAAERMRDAVAARGRAQHPPRCGEGFREPLFRKVTMFKRVHIAQHQIGLLSLRGNFEKFLPSGSHWLPPSAGVQLCDLADFPAQVPNVEWLLSAHPAACASHLEVVRTAVDEVAMVCRGQQLSFVAPNALQVYWKNYLPLEVLRCRLSSDLRVPANWLAKLPQGMSAAFLKQVSIPATGFGLLFVDDQFHDLLLPGLHAFFEVLPKTRLAVCPQSQVHETPTLVRPIVASGNALQAEHMQVVTTTGQQLGLWWDGDQLVHVTSPGVQALASKTLRLELVDLTETPRPPAPHLVPMLRGQAAAKLLAAHVQSYEVPAEHIGMFYVDGEFAGVLASGFHTYWHGGKRLTLTLVDTRLTVVEIAGQEILTQDKVQLRVNVTAGYKIVDARRALANLSDYKDFIYKEIQFALRAAIGGRTLDGMLENKNETDEQILGYMQQKAAVQGIEMVSLGIKDLILPGEIKAILGKVVEAEKAAQANVIRRREETAATRSLMNTAKVMEDNPVALRLKELETLEKITEKIEHLSVYGGLEGLLKQLLPFKPEA